MTKSAEHGDSIDLILDRDGVHIDLQLYEDGGLVLWQVNIAKYEKDDWEPDEPMMTIEEVTADLCRSAYRELGWTTPANGSTS